MAAHRRFLVPWFALVLSLPTVVTSRLNAQISVTPDGGSAIVALNSTEKSVSFTLYTGRSTTETWHVTPECLGVVTGCWSPNGYDFTFMQATGVTIKFSTPSPGSGTVRLRAERLGVTDQGWYNVTVDGTSPEIRLLAPTGDVGVEFPTIQLAWCDNTSLNAGSRWIKVNGVVKTSSFDYVGGGPPDCVVKATSTTNSVALNVGSNTVAASICDAAGNCGFGSFPVTRVTYGVAVTPDGATAPQRPANSSGHSENFTVQNTGTGQNTYNLSCGGSPNVTCTGLTINGTPVTSVTLAGGNSSPVTASYDVGVVGSGSLTLTASGTNANDNGSFTVPVVTPSAQPPIVEINSVNPGAFVQRSLCLTIAAGAAAASECGDLRIVHSLPTTRTMSKARTPTLLYNSQTAHPYPLIAANVTLPSAAAVPDSVTATVWIGPPQARRKWLGGQWAPGQTRRVAVGFDALSFATGVHGYTLEVINWYPAPTDSQVTRVNGELVIVNRSNSPFGAGWWLAGFEQLFWIADGRRLVVLGDGSARIYSPVAANLYTAPNPARPDTLDGRGTDYVRLAEHGVRVHYSATTGKHITTINRLGHVTAFNYDDCGRFSTIKLPPDTTSRVYTFTYASPTDCATPLVSVTAPPNGSENRVTNVTIIARQVTAIRDPDTHTVRFVYDPEFAYRVISRTDKRSNTTFYAFDVGAKLTMDSLPLGTGQTPIVQRFRPLESLGLVAAIDTAVAYTRLDGPRTDVPDTTAFWLDRFGAPRRIVNALGHETLVKREESTFPALATELRAPNGFVTRAKYDARGNVDTLIQVNPLADGQDAVTRYHWDQRWDFVDSIVTPMGVVTTMGYDPQNGNRLFQQLGPDVNRRVFFNYGNDQKLLSSVVAQSIITDSLVYDGQWNVSGSRTARGFWTSYYHDALGRDTLVVTPIDSTDKAFGGAADSTIRLRQRAVYTVVDRDSITESIAPNRAQVLRVDKRYDAEGNLTSLARVSVPDVTEIGTITSRFGYDRANRQVADTAPDGRVEHRTYDPAGNVRTVTTRRGHVITSTYDDLNRVKTRSVPSVTYQDTLAGIALRDNQPYPRRPNSGTFYVIGAEADTFTYDLLSNVQTANNGDARLTRTYYNNGLLQTETQAIRDAVGSTFTNSYLLRFTYDRDGRRRAVKLPSQLVPAGTRDSVAVTYDPLTGQLKTVTDPLGNVFTYSYTLRGEPSALAYPGSYTQRWSYLPDGSLETDSIRNTGGTTGLRWPNTVLRATRLKYDGRGKILLSEDAMGFRDTVRTSYSGLGHLRTSYMSQNGELVGFPEIQHRYSTGERQEYDALGNMDTVTTADTSRYNGTIVRASRRGRSTTYSPGVGRLLSESSADGSKTYVYDADGNIQLSMRASSPVSPSAEDRFTYYAADGRVRAADFRYMSNFQADLAPRDWVFEEYRYDALGRRVWVRTYRECADYEPLSTPEALECQISSLRRTVWDGKQELMEIQVPGADSVASAVLENDDYQARLPRINNQDPNPFYGRVLYVHGLGLDQPIAITRYRYVDFFWGRPYTDFPPTTISVFWNARQQVGIAACATGNRPCQHNGYDMGFEWASSWFAYDRPKFTKRVFQGTLIHDKQDATETVYRRNRYYDPASGRFTQEDPIGLAGGLNLYGFANGDPVNFSDPFGLCVPPVTPACLAVLIFKGMAIGAAVFGGTRVAYNAATDRPLGEGVHGDMTQGALIGASAGVGAAALTTAEATALTTATRLAAPAAGAAGALGSRADAIAKLRNLGPETVGMLREFFKSGQLPQGLTPEALQAYRNVADHAVRAGIDKLGIQAQRIQMIDEAMKKLQ